MIKIKDKAIFICDAHYNLHDRKLFYFLKDIKDKKIAPSQIFFMGDMFDLLVGEISYTHKVNKECIDLINEISLEIESFYIEGNHDFNLAKIFPNIKVFSIKDQPIKCAFYDHTILLSHGDWRSNRRYRFYATIIRNRYILIFLNIIDRLLNNFISKAILHSQRNKFKCEKIENFINKTKEKIKKYDVVTNEAAIVCEGHFHQGIEFMYKNIRYINFYAFVCDCTYYSISFNKKVIFQKKGQNNGQQCIESWLK